jgi:hypothetical protein
MAGWNLPPGCTNAMLDRATATEDRERCSTCLGRQWVLSNGAPIMGDLGVLEDDQYKACPDCEDGYEKPHYSRCDNANDDPYPEEPDGDIDF